MLNFKPLTWDDKERYDRYYSNCPVKCSEYSFFSLWGWREAMPVELAFTDKLCLIKTETPAAGIYGPVGNWNDEDANLDGILNFAKDNNLQLYDVPEDAANAINKAAERLNLKLELTEERDQWEYVYSVQDLIKLKGSKFAHKRNRVRTFESSYEWDYLPMLPEDFNDVLIFQENWREHRDESMNASEIASLLDEDNAIRTAIEYWDKFPLLGGILKVDDKIIAYTIAEELSPEMLDIRFEKAFGEYAGSYQAINQFFLKNQGANYKCVNREEDMGEEGLRAAKLSYNPVFMVKKYKILIK